MSAEEVADATLHAIERNRRQIILTFQAKLIAFINRFFPWLADRISAKKVRELYQDEIAAREQARQAQSAVPAKSLAGHS
jgi:hypothetical protein